MDRPNPCSCTPPQPQPPRLEIAPGSAGGFAVFSYPDGGERYVGPARLMFGGDLLSTLAYISETYAPPLG